MIGSKLYKNLPEISPKGRCPGGCGFLTVTNRRFNNLSLEAALGNQLIGELGQE